MKINKNNFFLILNPFAGRTRVLIFLLSFLFFFFLSLEISLAAPPSGDAHWRVDFIDFSVKHSIIYPEPVREGQPSVVTLSWHIENADRCYLEGRGVWGRPWQGGSIRISLPKGEISLVTGSFGPYSINCYRRKPDGLESELTRKTNVVVNMSPQAPDIDFQHYHSFDPEGTGILQPGRGTIELSWEIYHANSCVIIGPGIESYIPGWGLLPGMRFNEFPKGELKDIIPDRQGFYWIDCIGWWGGFFKSSEMIDDPPPTAEIGDIYLVDAPWMTRPGPPHPPPVYTPLSRAANIDFWHTRGFGIRFIFKDAGLSGLHTCQYRVGFRKHPLAPDTFTHWIDIKGSDEHGNTCSYENKDGIFEPVVYIDGCSYQGEFACIIEIRAIDGAGNESDKEDEDFNIDWTPPEAAFIKEVIEPRP